MARAADQPVAPFGATRNGVTGLVPEAKLIAGDGPVPEGRYGITEAQVDRWLDELTSAVAVEADGWERLTNVPVMDEEGTVVVIAGDRDRLAVMARDVVHNGAASYLEAARHPERAAVNDTSYAAVLWARYTEGLARLIAWLEARLNAPDAGDETEDEDVNAGALYSFPPVLIGDGLRF